MRYLAIAASVVFLTIAGAATAAPMSTAPGLTTGNLSTFELIQAKKKSETIGQKIKRAWRSLVDYQFCVRCPIIFPITASICSVKTGITGPNRDEARATCAARNPVCYVNDAPC